MIFITLGSQKFQFNRLLKAVDELIDKHLIDEKVFAQTGYSDYVPHGYQYKDFLDRDVFVEMMEKADLVITHAGTGAIITALKSHKKVIAIPRLKKYGEHVDNHQRQIVEQFARSEYICTCEECNELEYTIIKARNTEFREFKSNNTEFLNSLEEYIKM